MVNGKWTNGMWGNFWNPTSLLNLTERVFGDGTWWNIFTITNEISFLFCGKLPSDSQISTELLWSQKIVLKLSRVMYYNFSTQLRLSGGSPTESEYLRYTHV
jgi:hypothetical protein